MKIKLTIIFSLFTYLLDAQLSPAITSWVLNNGADVGYNNIPSNILAVQYSTNNVYIACNSVPGYTIGPWPGDPWQPGAQNFVYKITLNPQENTGQPIPTPYGHIGVWINGVSIYNPKDAHSWEDEGTWFQNAFYFENTTFDDCLGHPNNLLEYHTHVNPRCVYDVTDSTQHAPIIGFAFDGFPIYGAWGYANSDGSGGIKRMRTSYRLRNITDRTILPGGTVVNDTLQGPTLLLYPLGAYVQDYEYVTNLGDLDDHNGRFCVTPEYPNGTYAYFVSVDDALEPVYPYVLGIRYYGTVQQGNTGPNSGHNSVTEPVSVYTGINENVSTLEFAVYPSPAIDNISIRTSTQGLPTASIYSMTGKLLGQYNFNQSTLNNIDISNLPVGIYCLQIQLDGYTKTTKFTVAR